MFLNARVSLKIVLLLVFFQISSSALATPPVLQAGRQFFRSPVFRTTAMLSLGNLSGFLTRGVVPKVSPTQSANFSKRFYSATENRYCSSTEKAFMKFDDWKALGKPSSLESYLKPKPIVSEQEKLELADLKTELDGGEGVIKIVVDPFALYFTINGGHRENDYLEGRTEGQVMFLKAHSNGTYSLVNVVNKARNLGYRSSFKSLNENEVTELVDNLILLEEYTSENSQWTSVQKRVVSIIHDDIENKWPIETRIYGSTGEKVKISVERIDEIDLEELYSAES